MTDNSDNMSNEDMQSSSLRVTIDMMGRERPDRRDRLLYSPGSKTRRGGADVSVRKQGVSKARKRGDKVGPSLSLMVPSNVFLYKPEAELPDLTAYFSQTIEVKIEKKYITRDNPNVIKRKIWGSENYTSNSDIVCILLHFNQFNIDEFLSQKARDGINFFLTVGKRM